MRHLSLFAGIGGMELGFERAGMVTVGQVENDPYCVRVLEKHWPDVWRWGDIRTLMPRDMPEADVWSAGFPCQPTSVAGLRKGADDDRWLWPEVARLVGVVRPGWLVLENPPGILSLGFGRIADDLARLRYDFCWQVLSACMFGAPHTRERVFVVAVPAGWGTRMETHSLHGLFRGAADEQASLLVASDDWAVTPEGRVAGARMEGWEHTVGYAAPVAFLPGVVDGLSRRVDTTRRMKALGNAVVPQVAEWLGRRIMEAL